MQFDARTYYTVYIRYCITSYKPPDWTDSATLTRVIISPYVQFSFYGLVTKKALLPITQSVCSIMRSPNDKEKAVQIERVHWQLMSVSPICTQLKNASKPTENQFADVDTKCLNTS